MLKIKCAECGKYCEKDYYQTVRKPIGQTVGFFCSKFCLSRGIMRGVIIKQAPAAANRDKKAQELDASMRQIVDEDITNPSIRQRRRKVRSDVF